VTRAYVPLLVLLSLLWGASYLFIKVADRELQPTTLMLARVVIAAALLSAYLWHEGLLAPRSRSAF
jgi:drug/metabolite transporter (DMT)-like permease